MKRAVASVLFICLSLAGKAQVTLGYRLGYGTYSMQSVSDYQESILKACGFPAKIVEKFPAYFNQRFYIGNSKQQNINKLYFGYETTGGRINVSDYSGKWMFDMILNGYQGGFRIDVPGRHSERVEFHPYIDVGITSTVMKLEQYLEVGPQNLKDSYIFIANEVSFQPGITVMVKFRWIEAGCYAGYETGVSTAFHEKGNSNAKLGISSNQLTKPQWSGIRAGIEISYRFKKRIKS